MTAARAFADRGDVGEGAATLLDYAHSDGRARAIEVAGRAGMTPVDAGRGDNRYLYVVAGTWTIAVDDDERRCAADTTVFAPAGRTLRYATTGDAPGTLLVITMPA